MGSRPAESRGIIGACEGEGGVDRLLDLLDATDVGFDARVALEREHHAERRTVVGVVEVEAEHGEGSCGGGTWLPDCQAVADLASSPSELRPVPDLDPAGAGGDQEHRWRGATEESEEVEGEGRRRQGERERGEGGGVEQEREGEGAEEPASGAGVPGCAEGVNEKLPGGFSNTTILSYFFFFVWK